jgi:hypothetical protein
MVECWTCRGTGFVIIFDAIPCAACYSTGRLLGETCSACDGIGKIAAETSVACELCSGNGTVALRPSRD